MSQVDVKLKAGDWVEVKSSLEIAETLSSEGTLDGLPFMPEMLVFCSDCADLSRGDGHDV